MKKIALTQRLIFNDSYYEMREALDVNWASFLQKCGILPLPLPINACFEKYFEECSVAGVILTGGNDLERFSDDNVSKLRDAYEKEVIRYAVEKRLPILGVCRGMQIIGDYFGAEFLKVSAHAGVRHELGVINNSYYCKAIKLFTEVNSYHNYSIKTVPAAMRILARSIDGSIESVEHEKHKILAYMWHPERENPFNEKDIMLVREFFDLN